MKGDAENVARVLSPTIPSVLAPPIPPWGLIEGIKVHLLLKLPSHSACRSATHPFRCGRPESLVGATRVTL